MKNALSGVSSQWGRLSRENFLFSIFDVTLRGCAQVMFQNNPLTGFIFFIAIFVAAYGENNSAIAYGCLLGTITATLTGLTLPDRISWRAGLYSYNGCLVGVALPSFLIMSPLVWVCVILGSVVSVIATVCIADILKTWKIAALTAPFVLITWVILLSSYMFPALQGEALPEPKLAMVENNDMFHSLSDPTLFSALFHGISQVFLMKSVIAGSLFILGLTISSRWAAAFALLGSLLAMSTAMVLRTETDSIIDGLYSFSAVLTAIALGSAFNKPSLRIIAYTLTGIIFTVLMQGAMNVLVLPIGIPTLTMPFVLASWLFLVPNQEAMPEHRQSLLRAKNL